MGTNLHKLSEIQGFQGLGVVADRRELGRIRNVKSLD